MEATIATMKATDAVQTDMLKMQSQTLTDHSARIMELEARPDPPPRAKGSVPREVQEHSDLVEGDMTRSRKQSAASCEPSAAAARSQRVMGACCPASGTGHRRLQASCTLPDTCGTIQCADSIKTERSLLFEPNALVEVAVKQAQ